MIELIGVSKSYGRQQALHRTDLSVPAGRITVLIGPSGCGKSTLVRLMRALMLDPDALLLDEPLGALDPIIRSELQTDLRRIFQTLTKTVVLVTHDLSEAGFFGDLIVLLRAGKILQQGALADFLRA